MKSVNIAGILVLLMGGVHAQTNCGGLPDGPQGAGCRSFTCCQDGQGTIMDCPTGCVFNANTGKCDSPENVGPPCGELEDCSQLEDGSYPDMSMNCTWYYTCSSGIDMGKQQCADGLVFSYFGQQCTWPHLVFPPCGTRPPPTGPPPGVTPGYYYGEDEDQDAWRWPTRDECDVHDCPRDPEN